MKLPGALSKLSDTQYDELIRGLSMGLSDSKLADLLQKENGWLLDVKTATLVKTINRWRKSHAQNALTISVADKLTKPNGGVRAHLDTISGMERLILEQEKRLEKLRNTESMSPLLLSSLSDEIRALYVMYEKLAKIQMEIGVIRKVRVGQLSADYEPEPEEQITGPWTQELEAKYQILEAEFSEVRVSPEEAR